MDDCAAVARQLGRRPRAFRRVAVRCPWGRPAVTEQWPYDEAGRPFPTTYYLTCPHLVAQVSRLEAAGGVDRWSRAAAADPQLAESVERATEEQLRLRGELAELLGGAHGPPSSGGIGGSGNRLGLKCLHAHVAYALARPGYVLGERVAAELEPLWPEACCTAD